MLSKEIGNALFVGGVGDGHGRLVEPSSASLLLASPIPRLGLLATKRPAISVLPRCGTHVPLFSELGMESH